MKVELLAPAGSYEALEAAFEAGADAVYLGGQKFGARAYADNLDQEQLIRAIDLAHLKGKQLYLTINTLLKNRELETELYEYLAPLYEAGLDAVIVQDPGVMDFVKTYFPGLHIHASTQMTITGVESAKLLQKAGATRVVTARELSLEEIKKILRCHAYGNREFRSRSPLLLLFRSVPDEQHDRRKKRKPGKMCTALPFALSGLSGRKTPE